MLAPEKGGSGSEKKSTREGKSGNLNPKNEQIGSPFRKTAQDRAGRFAGAEKLTRDELKRIARPDSGIPPEFEIQSRYWREVDALGRLRESDPRLAIEPNPDREIGGGSEHLVEHLATDPARVLKHTRDPEPNAPPAADFGYTLDSSYLLIGTGDYRGMLTLRPATPSEYLERMDAENEVFGGDAKIVGITRVNGRIGLAVSQTAVKGGEPSPGKLKVMMEARGFRKVSDSKMEHDQLMGKTWYDAKSRTLVADVKPENFKMTPEGRILAVDVIVRRLSEGSDLHDILMAT